MTINDLIHGKVTISEPVLVELIKSKPIQRLKQIHQNGANYFYWPEADKLNRFNHSIGVMLLIRRLGGSLEEQVAGLLHDVSHAAFSHALDALVGNRDHTAHEEITERYVNQTQLPAILRQHGYNPRRIFNHQLYSLLEQPSPALCADRLDYFLRDGLAHGVVSGQDIKKISADLTVFRGRIVTQKPEVALMIGERYLEMDRGYWATSRESLAINYAVVEILKRGIELGIIRFEDLWKYSDDELMAILRQTGDSQIESWLSVLNPEVSIQEDRRQFDVNVFPRIRTVDPPVLQKGKLLKISEINPAFAEQLAEARAFPQELYLRFNQ